MRCCQDGPILQNPFLLTRLTTHFVGENIVYLGRCNPGGRSLGAGIPSMQISHGIVYETHYVHGLLRTIVCQTQLTSSKSEPGAAFTWGPHGNAARGSDLDQDTGTPHGMRWRVQTEGPCAHRLAAWRLMLGIATKSGP